MSYFENTQYDTEPVEVSYSFRWGTPSQAREDDIKHHYAKIKKMIVKRKLGFYVLSEKTRRNLGGPYKTKEEAKKRLSQVEYFKHLKR